MAKARRPTRQGQRRKGKKRRKAQKPPSRRQQTPIQRTRPAKPRPKKAPKRQRKARQPVIVRKPPPPIRLKEKVMWRKGSRWVKEGTPGAVKHEWLMQVSPTGKILRTIEHVSPHEITKTVLPGTIEEDHSVSPKDAPSGHSQGMLAYAFAFSNIYTTVNRGAKLIEVSIRGRDTREKVQRIKLSIEPESQRDLHKLLISRIIGAMREAGLRTSYTMEMLRAAKERGPLARRLSYQKFRSLEPLHDLDIVVTVYR